MQLLKERKCSSALNRRPSVYPLFVEKKRCKVNISQHVSVRKEWADPRVCAHFPQLPVGLWGSGHSLVLHSLYSFLIDGASPPLLLCIAPVAIGRALRTLQ